MFESLWFQVHRFLLGRLQWWGSSRADEWTLEVAGEDRALRYEVAHKPNTSAPGFNAQDTLTAWSIPTRFVRLTMKGGHKDPWGFNVLLGIREFELHGKRAEQGPRYQDLWIEGDTTSSAPGFWLAIEHPRSLCEVGSPDPAKKNKARTAVCELRLPEQQGESISQGSTEVWSSLGFFDDGAKDQGPSQVRRAFREYLECVRGEPMGQQLHYNSWYDLRGGGWDHLENKHNMSEENVAVRMEAINQNLSTRGAGTMDAFLLDDGWDDWDSLWEVSQKRFPHGFGPLLNQSSKWNTSLGLWMSPFGGYEQAAAQRLKIGANMGLEMHPGRGFALSGPRYYHKFKEVAVRRIEEGFRMFKFDGLGGGLGQSGAGNFVLDFEQMLRLISELRCQADGCGSDGSLQMPVLTRTESSSRRRRRKRLWINLTIGTWPSLFWLLWADSIWRDGIDVGLEGEGSLREKWLTFRDASLLRALRRGPLFPLPCLMQHGLVWSRTSMAADLWDFKSPPDVEDFRKEVLTYFLSGVGLQELYLQLELMDAAHWSYLAEMVSFARRHEELLRDAHWIGGNPSQGEAYGVASFGPSPRATTPRTEQDHEVMGVLYWRNPSPTQTKVRFTIMAALELPGKWLSPAGSKMIVCWSLADLQLKAANGPKGASEVRREDIVENAADLARVGAREKLGLDLQPFEVRAFVLHPTSCTS